MKAVILITLISAFTYSTFAYAHPGADTTQNLITQAQPEQKQKTTEETALPPLETNIIVHPEGEYCASCVGGMF